MCSRATSPFAIPWQERAASLLLSACGLKGLRHRLIASFLPADQSVRGATSDAHRGSAFSDVGPGVLCLGWCCQDQ